MCSLRGWGLPSRFAFALTQEGSSCVFSAGIMLCSFLCFLNSHGLRPTYFILLVLPLFTLLPPAPAAAVATFFPLDGRLQRGLRQYLCFCTSSCVTICTCVLAHLAATKLAQQALNSRRAVHPTLHLDLSYLLHSAHVLASTVTRPTGHPKSVEQRSVGWVGGEGGGSHVCVFVKKQRL